MDLDLVKEGTTLLEVPRSSSYTFQGRYAPFKAPVFYNPRMEFSRDLSVMALRVFVKERKPPISICDPLAGLGARGIRYANEVQNVKSVMGDLNADAIPLILKNADLNGVSSKVEVFEKDANLLLAESSEPGKRHDFIDIDPFGTPVHFLSSAVRAVKNKGILAVTATDTAPLCGVHPRACIRKYASVPLRTEYCHETALRIMIGSVVMEALKHDFGTEVLLSYSVDHYLRAFTRLTLGARRGDRAAADAGFLLHCPSCGWREKIKLNAAFDPKCSTCGGSVSRAGPLWCGQLSDPSFLDKMLNEDRSLFNTSRRIEKFLRIVREECEMPISFYVIDNLSSSLKRDVPPIKKVIESLKAKGHKATLTHFHPKAIKTTAPISDIKSAIRGI